MPTHACTRCDRTTEAARLPRGWKDLGGPCCGDCVRAGWSVRGVTLPVARILGRQDGGPTSEPEPVEGFLRHFLPAWRMTTDLSNWAMQEIVRRDVRRTPDMETLPRYASCNLYRAWNETCPPALRSAWDGAAGSASAVLKAVEDRWKARLRYEVLWRGSASPMTHRSPAAYPVRRQEWRIVPWVDGSRGAVHAVSLTLPGSRYLLELDRSPELRRPLRDFAALASGGATPADLRLVPVSRGGRVVGAKLTLCGRFPRPAGREGPTAVVRTDPRALLVVEVPDRDPWVLHCDHLPRVVRQYGVWLERSRVDLKHEKRWPAAKRRRWVRRRQPAIDRHRGRIDSELKQAVRAAVSYAVRLGCAAVVYDDSERSYLESWPWFVMRERARCICAEGGVAFQHVDGAADEAGVGA